MTLYRIFEQKWLFFFFFTEFRNGWKMKKKIAENKKSVEF